MRIVVDTNVWVSGLLWRGPAWRLLRLAESGDLQLCIASAMLLELAEVLGYDRLQDRLSALGETPDSLTAYALSIALPVDVSRGPEPIVPDDPDDDIFILCAVIADAEAVVTADPHLLRL